MEKEQKKQLLDDELMDEVAGGTGGTGGYGDTDENGWFSGMGGRGGNNTRIGMHGDKITSGM